MFFSILIPVYNTSQYLDECINSVLSQTEKDYEIVLIDDGSTDNSGDICDSYAQKYSFVRVIHKQNEGLMMTRRRGFKEANGEYFICLDSDDYLCDNEALHKIKCFIEEKNCDLVLYNFFMEKAPGSPGKNITLFDKPDGYVFEDKKELYNKLLIGAFLNPMWIKAANRNVVDIDVDYYQWQQDICRGEDLFQSFPILNNAQIIGYVNQTFLHYRWTQGSISNNPKLKFYKAYRAIYLREDKYLKKWNIDDQTYRKSVVKRIPHILGIINYGYSVSKKNKDFYDWNVFVKSLSTDNFFISLFDKKFKNDINPYYWRLGRSIINNHILAYKIYVKLYEIYSGLNKRK